jgi:glycosyltransferase involved in cell wall biosynthesis
MNYSKKKVVIRAPLLSVSGYGVHSRQVFKWLRSRDDFDVRAQVVPWGNTSWMINPDMENSLVQDIMQLSSPHSDQPDISFQIQLPDEWDPDLAKFNVGLSAVVETDFCNPAWIESMNKMDCIIVPSQHIKKTIESTGTVTKPLFVIPEWYLEEIDKENIDKLDVDFDTGFNFLTIAQFTGNDPENDRKNLYYTVKWFCEVFKDDPDVGLVLKVNHGRGTSIDRQLTKNKMRQVISQVREGSFPKIHVIHGNLTSEEVASLYRHPKIMGLISLTRGEGFGLPLLEAAASELPVIATNWSAHLDFLGKGKFIPIHYDMVEVPGSRIDNRIFLEGMKWANPVESDFKKKIEKIRHKYNMPKQWARDLSTLVKSEFSSKAVIEKYNKIIDEVLKSK